MSLRGRGHRAIMLTVAIVGCVAADIPAARGDASFAQDQLIVEFVPGAIGIPPNPGSRRVSLANAEIESPLLSAFLHGLGVLEFELIGRQWRWLPDEAEFSDHKILNEPSATDVRLKSFRDIYVVHFSTGGTLLERLAALRSNEFVEWAGRHPLLEPSDYWPDDPYLPCPETPCEDNADNYQWNMENVGGTIRGIECDSLTDIGLRGAYAIWNECAAKIALMDTGVQKYDAGPPATFHEDLEDNLDYDLGRNFSGSPADTLDWDDDAGGGFTGHGTQSAGIIGAIHNEVGVTGICGNFNGEIVVPLKIFPADTTATPGALASSIIDAIAYTASSDIPVAVVETNLTIEDDFDANDVTALKGAFYNAHHSGVTIICTAGNANPGVESGGNFPPDFLRLAYAVTAVGCDGSRDAQLSTGARVDISAPSSANNPEGFAIGQIVTTTVGNSYVIEDGDLFGGTSAAAPHVAAIASLLQSHSPELTNEDTYELLSRTAWTMGDPDTFGAGLVRVDEALDQLAQYELVHAATTDIDTSYVVAPCRPQEFKNVNTFGSPNISVGESEYQCRVDVYAFETTVSLTENTTSHVPWIWARGRDCAGARNATTFDGGIEPRYGEVVSVSSTEATLRGYAYKVYGVTPPCTADSLRGWYPINPTLPPSLSTKFAYTYLAEGGSSPREHESSGLGMSSGEAVRLGPSGAHIRFRSPGGDVKVEIFDLAGRRLASLNRQSTRGGPMVVVWDGLQSNGHPAPSGVYFARVTVGAEQGAARVLVVR